MPILLAIIAMAFLSIVVIFAIKHFSTRKLTELEAVSFNEKTADVVNFLELFEKTSDDSEADMKANIISFALQLNYADTGEFTLSAKKIQNIIDSHISTDLNVSNQVDEDFIQVLVRHNIFYTQETSEFELLNPYSNKRAIAKMPIQKYILKDVSLKDNQYIAIYEKYVIEDPYQALARTSQDDIQGKHSINAYLDGRGTPLSIKEVITNENIQDIAKPDREVEAIYALSNDSILLQEIK